MIFEGKYQQTLMTTWIATLLLYPLMFKLINTNISHVWGLVVCIIYGLLNGGLAIYAFYYWYRHFKTQDGNQKQALLFFLLILNGLVIIGFITSLLFRIFDPK